MEWTLGKVLTLIEGLSPYPYAGSDESRDCIRFRKLMLDKNGNPPVTQSQKMTPNFPQHLCVLSSVAIIMAKYKNASFEW